MKKITFLIYAVFWAFFTGCRAAKTLTTDTHIPLDSPSPFIVVTSSRIMKTLPVATLSPRQTMESTFTTTPTTTNPPTKILTLTKTTTLTPEPIVTPSIPSEARLKLQCMDMASTIPSEAASSSTVILESRSILDNGRYRPDTFLLDMETGKTTQIALQNERQSNHVVSPDGKLFAYHSIISNSEGNVEKAELVIANSEGRRQKVIPWETDWLSMPQWLDNQHLAISFYPNRNISQRAASILVLNLDNGERQILSPQFPELLNMPRVTLPNWGGWNGVVYNSLLTRAIYPRFIGTNEEQYTYAMWDLTKQELIASLENIISASSALADFFPTPRWSPDGFQFVFNSRVNSYEAGYVEEELFLVNQDGRVNQWTHLYPYGGVLDNFSWSPDGKYIAMFLATQDVYYPKARVVVLDTTTLDISDYCISITYGGEEYGLPGMPPPLPVWSPDSTQFLVVDQYQKNHRNVVLVDIAKGIATKIAEDMEPVGWMVNPSSKPQNNPNQIRAMLIDNNGNLWTGGPDGVVFWNVGTGIFTEYTTKDGLASNNVVAIAQTPDNAIWFGTSGAGLSRFDGEKWQTYNTRNGLPGDYIASLITTPDGRLWVDTVTTRYVADPGHTGYFGQYDGKNWMLLYGGGFDSVVAASDGSFWASSFLTGLWHFNEGKLNVQFPLEYITALAVDPEGVAWVATTTNIYRIISSTLYRLDPPGMEQAETGIATIGFAPGNITWFGFSSVLPDALKCGFRAPSLNEWGAYRYDGNKWKHFTVEDGLADNKICTIVTGKDGTVWFGTYDKGVSRFDGQNWTTYAVP